MIQTAKARATSMSAEWAVYEAEMERYRNGQRRSEPMRPFQYGSHIDTMPIERNPRITTNLPALRAGRPGRDAPAPAPGMIDSERRRVDGVHLTPNEWSAFVLLYNSRGHVVPRAQLVQHIWPAQWPPNQPRTLIWSLRRRLRGTPYQVCTHIGIGTELLIEENQPT